MVSKTTQVNVSVGIIALICGEWESENTSGEIAIDCSIQVWLDLALACACSVLQVRMVNRFFRYIKIQLGSEA